MRPLRTKAWTDPQISHVEIRRRLRFVLRNTHLPVDATPVPLFPVTAMRRSLANFILKRGVLR